MLSDNFNLDVANVSEDASFKSCFARSVVVNSQHSSSKNLFKERERRFGNTQARCDNFTYEGRDAVASSTPIASKHNSGNSFKKGKRLTENPSFNNVNDIRYATASSRIAEVPVENVFSKSQIETLEWQLKQTEASREMYRAVMFQVVKFLEKAHHSLKILGSKLNSNSFTIPRSKHDSDRWSQVLPELSSFDSTIDIDRCSNDTWKRSKKLHPPLEEILPEKLSQEAFMLLRTAESLLNTREPDLTHANADKDLKFLTQLAKEFPASSENRSSQCGDYSELSTTISLEQSRLDNNRVVLELEHQVKRNSDTSFTMNSNQSVLSSTFKKTDSIRSYNSIKSTFSNKLISYDIDLSKKASEVLPASNASSAEDESGFSSITSFQDLGIPVAYSILPEESDRTTHNTNGLNQCQVTPDSNYKQRLNDLKLWSKHIDASSSRCVTPSFNSKAETKSNLHEEKPLKVLWV